MDKIEIIKILIIVWAILEIINKILEEINKNRG